VRPGPPSPAVGLRCAGWGGQRARGAGGGGAGGAGGSGGAVLYQHPRTTTHCLAS